LIHFNVKIEILSRCTR